MSERRIFVLLAVKFWNVRLPALIWADSHKNRHKLTHTHTHTAHVQHHKVVVAVVGNLWTDSTANTGNTDNFPTKSCLMAASAAETNTTATRTIDTAQHGQVWPGLVGLGWSGLVWLPPLDVIIYAAHSWIVGILKAFPAFPASNRNNKNKTSSSNKLSMHQYN